MNDLFVNEAYRSQKIGERLFQQGLKYAKEQDFAWLQWETTKDNHKAQALYQKMGGQISDLLVYEIELG